MIEFATFDSGYLFQGMKPAVHPRAVIRVYDGAGNVIETHSYAGDFKEW